MKKVLLFLCAMMVAQLANAWYVVGSSTAFGNWSPEAAPEMTADGENYILKGTTLNNGDEFKFCEYQSWDSNYGPGTSVVANAEYTCYSNGNNAVWAGETVTCDIIFNPTTKKMQVYVEGAEVVEPTDYYVYFDNSVSNWATVYVYAWNGAAFEGWPGTALTDVTAEGYYRVTYSSVTDPTGAGLIFNNNDGEQTSDLTWRNNAIYTKNGDTGNTYGEAVVTETLTYNVTVPEGTPSCFITGEMNGWSFTEMTMVDATHYTITLDEVTKAMKYKYTATASWDNVEVQADGVSDIQDRTYNENDIVAAWKGMSTGTTENLTYTVTVPAGTESCYIVGAFNEWTDFVAMDKVNDTQFTITIENTTKSSGYKYTCGESWDFEEVTADGGTVQNRTWSENDVVAAWKSTPSEQVETLVYTVTVPDNTVACFISGGMNGWGFTEMTKIDTNVYSITFDNVTRSMRYKYLCGEDWEYEEVTADGGSVQDRTYNENDVVVAWKNLWSGVADVTTDALKVYGATGMLCVRTTEDTTLNIYNAQGMLVKAIRVNGNADINLTAGLYIVNGAKVLVY